jgi:O-antigen/teichoic acid export membrane protein
MAVAAAKSWQSGEGKDLGTRTARSGAVYVTGQVLGSIAILALFAVLARLFSVTNWGLYSIVIAFYTLFSTLGNFTIGTAMRKKLVELNDRAAKRAMLSNAYIATIAISTVLAVAGVAVSGYVAGTLYHQPGLAHVFMLAAALVWFWALFNLTMASLVALDRAKEGAIIDMIYSYVQLAAAPALVLLGYGIMGAVAGLGIGIVVATAIGLLFVTRAVGWPGLHFDLKQTKSILSFAAPVYLSSLVAQGVYSFALLFAAGFVTAAVVGNYNIGYEMGGGVGIIISTTAFVLLPAFSKVASRDSVGAHIGPSLNRSVYYTLLFLAPIVAYIVSVSTPLVFILFSHKYVYAPLYLSLVAVGLAIGVIWNYASTMLLGMGAVRKFLRYQLLAAAIELALLFVLTPVFKIIGMIVGVFIIFQAIMDIIYILEFKRSVSYRPEFGKPARVAAASVLLFALLYAVSSALSFGYIALLTNVALVFLVYPPLLAALNGITAADIEFLRGAFGAGRVAAPLSRILDYTAVFVRR